MSTGAKVSTAVRAAFYVTVFVLLWSWLALAVRPLDDRIGVSPPRWVAPIGAVLLLVGAVLGLSCVVLFVAAGRGTPAPFDPPREFVATGPYRYVRNPMYLGGLALVSGAGLALRSVSIVALAVLFFAVMHLFVSLYEEPSLERRFGESYREYRGRVNRWWPRSPRR